VKTVPFWVDDSPRPEGLPSDLPAETEYLIVGSGFTGLTCALRLAEAGREVTVIDAGEIASGASSVNGGMVSPDVKAGMRAVMTSFGPEVASEVWASTVRATELVRELARRFDALVSEAGLAALGTGERHLKVFAEMARWYGENFGTEWEVLGPARVGEVVGGDHFQAAMFEPEGFGVQPAKLAFGLAKAGKDTGAVLVDRCEVTGMEDDQSGTAVVTEKGTIRTGTVILATNGYTTHRPSPTLAQKVVSIGSYIIVTEPLRAERAGTIFPTGAMAYTKRRLLNYMRRTPDDRILLGGRRNLRPDLDLSQSAHDLRRQLLTYWPKLEDVEITHVWGGRLGVTFDLLPHIGRADGAWYVLGYGGHGVALSTGLGHELAGMLLGEDPPSVFSRIPHPKRFYYRGGKAWFLTPASVLYRILDRVGM
jgi:glycine/D-amino acid oxidase-like deaminating enzyme